MIACFFFTPVGNKDSNETANELNERISREEVKAFTKRWNHGKGEKPNGILYELLKNRGEY